MGFGMRSAARSWVGVLLAGWMAFVVGPVAAAPLAAPAPVAPSTLTGAVSPASSSAPPSAPASPSSPEDLSPAAARLLPALGALSPDHVGTDRHGNLWAWSRERGRVVLFDREGREIDSWSVPGAGAVDADGDWGVVALGPRGQQLLQPGSDVSPILLEIEGGAKNVAWVGEDRVAVMPALASHRVEIRDLASGRVLQRMDREGAVPPGPGTRPARSTEVEVDPESGRLYVLDSFSGELEVFDPQAGPEDGPVRRLEVQDPQRQEFEDWLQQSDARARREGSVQRPAIWRFQLDLDDDGAAWIGKPCGEPGVAHLVRLPPRGEPQRLEIETTCCSTRFAIWGQHVVFHWKARPGMDECYAIRRLP